MDKLLPLIRIIITYSLHGALLTSYMEPKYNRKKTINYWIISSCISVFISSIIYLSFPFPLHISIGYAVAGIHFFITFILLSEDVFPKKVFLYSVFLGVFVTVFSMGALTCRLFNIDSLNISFFIQSTIYALIIYWYCSSDKNSFRNIHFENTSQWWHLTVIVLLFAVIITAKLVIIDNVWYLDFEDILWGYAIILLMLVTYLTVFRTIGYLTTIAKNQNQLVLTKLYEKQMQSLHQIEDETKRTRHDFRHHNAVIAEYAKQGNTSALLEYLSVYEHNADTASFVRYSENDIVNSIISDAKNKAFLSGIDFKTEIALSRDCPVKSVDWVSMLSNILENAIHACQKSFVEDSVINLSINQKYNKLIVRCENTCNKSTQLNSKGLPENDRKDGIGVYSILNCVNAYNGDYDFKVSDGIFTLRLILNLPVDN